MTRGVQLVEPTRGELVEMPVPEPGRGEVRVRLEGCGVCGSNLPVWEGRPWFTYPMEVGAPGHEGWGVVDAVGPGVTSVSEGDRVAALSYHAFATHDIARADGVVRLPAALDGVPFPAEPLACAVNVFRRARVQESERVAIVGMGFLGSLLAMLAVGRGAFVTAVSRRPYALEAARSLGAEDAVMLDDPQKAINKAREATRDEGFDCVIEAVGNQVALDVASALVRIRGRLIVAGYHQDGPRTVDMQDWNWKGIDVINAHERDPAVYRQGMEEAIDLAVRGQWHPERLYTDQFALDELPDAMRAMQQRPDGYMKALVLCN